MVKYYGMVTVSLMLYTSGNNHFIGDVGMAGWK